MGIRLSFIVLGVAAVCAGSISASGVTDSEYAAVTTRIFQRIGTLQDRFPAVDWPREVGKAKVMPDGAGGLAVERGVEWVPDHPGEPPGKLNGVRPVYQESGAFWFRLTFYRGPWKGAAVFQSIDFGDLHLWFDSGYKDDAAVIRAVAQIVQEECRAFKAAAIDKLAARLAKDSLWQNGLFQKIELANNATPEEVERELFRRVSFDEGHVTDFNVEEVKQVKIGTNDFLAVQTRTNLGEKIILMRYENSKTGWWTRVFNEEK